MECFRIIIHKGRGSTRLLWQCLNAFLWHASPPACSGASHYNLCWVFPLFQPLHPTGLSLFREFWRENLPLSKLHENSVRYMWCSKSPAPLGVLFHVVQVGSHDKMFRVNKTVLVRVLLPARVVALVGDIALASPRLKLPQVQPRLVVL